MVIPVHKKGRRLTCSNYRAVSLLRVAGEWFGTVSNARLRGCTMGRVMKEQRGLGERARICIV